MLNIALRAARKAGELIERAWERGDLMKFEEKGRNDYVSEADRTAEREVIETIHKHYPDHAILAEESGSHGKADYQWARRTAEEFLASI